MNIPNHDKIIKFGITAGTLWTVVAAIAALISRLQLTFFIPGSGILGYGLIRPVYTTALIYGAILSFAVAATYYIIEKNEGAGSLRFPLASFAGFIMHQVSVVLGILTILCESNKGREYGEMSWISDAMFSLSVLVAMFTMCVNMKNKESLSRSTVFAIAGMVGIFITHLLGNISLPYWISGSTIPFNGIQDAAAQEFYRMGVLGFFILIPTFASAYYFIPSYFNAPLYSAKLADFQLLTMIVLIPLSGSVGLVYSSAPQLSQTIGIVANAALGVSILAGAMNLYYTIGKSGSNTKSPIGSIFKTGILFTIIYAVIRSIAGLRIVQERFAFTAWNMQDISIDASLYALPLIFAGIYIMVQKIQNQNISDGMIRIQMFLFFGAFAVVVIAGILQGSMSYYNLISLTEEGAFKIASWSEATYMATAKGGANLVSFNGLSFLGYLLMVGSLMMAALNTAKTLLSGGRG